MATHSREPYQPTNTMTREVFFMAHLRKLRRFHSDLPEKNLLSQRVTIPKCPYFMFPIVLQLYPLGPLGRCKQTPSSTLPHTARHLGLWSCRACEIEHSHFFHLHLPQGAAPPVKSEFIIPINDITPINPYKP